MVLSISMFVPVAVHHLVTAADADCLPGRQRPRRLAAHASLLTVTASPCKEPRALMSAVVVAMSIGQRSHGYDAGHSDDSKHAPHRLQTMMNASQPARKQ
jgi:hypothetical protein